MTLRAAVPIAASFAISAAVAAMSVDDGPLVPLAVAVTYRPARAG